VLATLERMPSQTYSVDPDLIAKAEVPNAASFATDVPDELAALDDACTVLLHVLTLRGKRSDTVPMEDDEELPEQGEYTPLMQRAAPLWKLQAQRAGRRRYGIRQPRLAAGVVSRSGIVGFNGHWWAAAAVAQSALPGSRETGSALDLGRASSPRSVPAIHLHFGLDGR
jgi:hypothetical protein